MRTHPEIDARSLALHCLIAQKIRNNPALLEQAKHTLMAWRSKVAAASLPYLDEWEKLLNQGLDTCLAVATAENEYATALRQSSPFTSILSHQERFIFLRTWKAEHEAQ